MIQINEKNEKWDKPTYPLNEVKKLLSNPKTRGITKRALVDAFSLGFVGEDEIISVVMSLKQEKISNGGHFHKSQCVNEVLNMWHDIYKIAITDEQKIVKIYIKLQIQKNGVVISFHEDEGRYS